MCVFLIDFGEKGSRSTVRLISSRAICSYEARKISGHSVLVLGKKVL